MDKAKIKAQFLKYSKEQIIDAMLSETIFNEASHILHRCWHTKHDELYRAMCKAGEEENVALTAFIEYQKELAAKYGDGEKFKFSRLSAQESIKYDKLSAAWDETRKRHEKANKQIDTFYKECKL